MSSGRLHYQLYKQPYKIAFSATGVLQGAVQLFLFIIFSVIFTYTIIFLPLSYVNEDQVRDIWLFGIWTLWGIAFFFSVFLSA